MTRLSRGAVWAISIGLLPVAAAFFGPAPAQASCIPSPLTSPYYFTGTVTAVSNAGSIAITVGNAGRTATVHTDDGRTVTVLGSDAAGPNAATSVDRTYQVGVRYEFHPLNATSPYQDNACTATHPIGGSTSEPGGPGADAGTSLWLGIAVAAILLTGTGLWLRRRRTSRPTAGHTG